MMDDFNEIQVDEQPEFHPPSAFKHSFTKMIGDMKFVGIFFIISGAFSCLSIIGAVFGIPIIIMGLRIREAADKFDGFSRTNDKKFLKQGFELQGTFFKIYKILIIVGIVVFILYFIFIIWFIMSGISAFNQYSY